MESCEHVAVGDSIQLTTADGKQAKAAGIGLPVGDRSLSYGHLIAVGGDFYGVGARPKAPGHPALAALEPISSAQQPDQAFESAFQTLVDAPRAELEQIISVMDEEQKAIDEAREAGKQPSVAYEELGDSLSYKWNEITGGGPASLGVISILLHPGRYINLASVNMDHFGADAVKAYLAGHGVAMRAAAALHGQDPSAPGIADKLLGCYAMNGFADHFLTDLFAAGHVRTPRRALWATPETIAGETGLLTRAAHNEDNHDGLHMSNARGDTWVEYGDGMELDDVNAKNFALAIAATQASANEVYQAFATGVATVQAPAALTYIPKLDFSARPVPGGPDHAPLFWADPQNNVYRRGGSAGFWPDKNNYDFVFPFSDAEMVAQIKNLMTGGATTTSIACYLQKGSDITWYWGLNNDNSYYKLNGFWITTQYTKLQKFVTDTSPDQMLAAAANAIRYNNKTGYSVIAVFAADKSGGYNYPIIVGESAWYPRL